MAQRVHNQNGQTLVEVLIALGSAVTIIVAIAGVTVVALNNAQYSRSQVLATQYSQEGIEFMKKVRDANITAFNAYSVAADGSQNNTRTFCYDLNAKTLRVKGLATDCVENVYNTNNKYTREIEVEKDSPYCQPSNPPAPTPPLVATNAIRIKSTVYWTDSKCTGTGAQLYCHKSEQTICLSDFTTRPAP